MRKIYNKKYLQWLESNKTKGVITLFTPTYNRAKYLERVYNCIVSQTSDQYIWILVNDGSTDNTETIAVQLLNRNDIPILYISKVNGGKHSAFEAALNETCTEYFMCMDDDDLYAENAVETFLTEWEKIKKEGLINNIGAIRTLTKEEDGHIVMRGVFPDNMYGKKIDQTTLESNYIKKEYFENWTCYRTDALKQCDLFPKNYWLSNNHKFFSEAIWQGRFARKYKCRYYFVVLRQYRHDTDTSIIRGIKNKQHYLDMFINTKLILDEQLDYIKKDTLSLLKSAAIVSILRVKLSIPIAQLLKNTKSNTLKIFYILSFPFAWMSQKPIMK